MRVLVTGSSGHLGEALMRILPEQGYEPVGLDISPGPQTNLVGTITDREFVRRSLSGIEGVLHAATLHKPHVATHSKQAFVDTNISGTLNLLEEASASQVRAFVFTSTTSAFGDALSPARGEPAAWIDETVPSIPRNIYGATKTAAEDLCQLFARKQRLPCIVLRTSRFFPEDDDNPEVRAAFAADNLKANEFLHRRVDIGDAADAHSRALERASTIGFGRYVISATSPFTKDDLEHLRSDATAVVASRFPGFREIYARRNFRMFDAIDRVYVNSRATADLGWSPHYDFATILSQLDRGSPIGSPLSHTIGAKGYHAEAFDEGPYPVL